MTRGKAVFCNFGVYMAGVVSGFSMAFNNIVIAFVGVFVYLLLSDRTEKAIGDVDSYLRKCKYDDKA